MQSRHICSFEILSTIEGESKCIFFQYYSLQNYPHFELNLVCYLGFGVKFEVFLVHLMWRLEGLRGHSYSQIVSSVPL